MEVLLSKLPTHAPWYMALHDSSWTHSHMRLCSLRACRSRALPLPPIHARRCARIAGNKRSAGALSWRSLDRGEASVSAGLSAQLSCGQTANGRHRCGLLPPQMISVLWLTDGCAAHRQNLDGAPADAACGVYFSRAADWLGGLSADWKTLATGGDLDRR